MHCGICPGVALQAEVVLGLEASFIDVGKMVGLNHAKVGR
jgi:hypothetical protein